MRFEGSVNVVVVLVLVVVEGLVVVLGRWAVSGALFGALLLLLLLVLRLVSTCKLVRLVRVGLAGSSAVVVPVAVPVAVEVRPGLLLRRVDDLLSSTCIVTYRVYIG